MTAFPAFGLFIHESNTPAQQMECPDHVWNMIEAGSLQREEVTESIETMRGYNCDLVYSEREPFSPTNLMLFGIVTGFAVGAMVTRKAHSTMVTPAHHGEGERCHYCNYGTKNRSRMPLSGLRGRHQRKRIPQAGRSPRNGPAPQRGIRSGELQDMPTKRLGQRRDPGPNGREPDRLGAH